MKILKEEREAIVEAMNPLEFQDFKDGRWYTNVEKLKTYLRTALLSHEEKVVARYRTQLRTNLTDYANQKFLGGMVIDPVELYEALTSPLTDEKV